MNTSSFKRQMKNLSQNKIVLYILLILAVTNLFGYLMSENYTAILMFLVVGYLTTYFTKNMIIVFGTAIITTNFVVAMNFTRNRRENFDDKKDESKEDNDEDNEKNKEKQDNQVVKEDDSNVKTLTGRNNIYKKNEYDPSTGKKYNTTTINAKDAALNEDNKDPKNPVMIGDKKNSDDVEGTCTGPNCKASSKTAKIEQAHSVMQNLMNNPEAMKEMQKQQAEITKTIQDLEPLVDKVEGMMNKLGGSKIANLIGGLGKMM